MRSKEIRAAAVAASAQIFSTVVAASVATDGGKTNITTGEVIAFAEYIEDYIRSGR